MARKVRVEYPAAGYHVLNRGERREPIFRDDEDRLRFISTLEEGRAAETQADYRKVRRGMVSGSGFFWQGTAGADEGADTVKWMAERLKMGTPGYVNHLFYDQRNAKGKRVANIKTR